MTGPLRKKSESNAQGQVHISKGEQREDRSVIASEKHRCSFQGPGCPVWTSLELSNHLQGSSFSKASAQANVKNYMVPACIEHSPKHRCQVEIASFHHSPMGRCVENQKGQCQCQPSSLPTSDKPTAKERRTPFSRLPSGSALPWIFFFFVATGSHE